MPNLIHVLVVEDEPLVRMSIVDGLLDEGFVVFEASNADEAIRELERTLTVQLVFTDVDMPGSMDGLRLAMFVRDRWPPIKIIITSGHHRPLADEILTEAPFLPKPYRSGNVVATIRSLL